MCILFPSCPFHHHHVITASGFGGASCLRLRKSPWDTSKKTIAMLGYLQQDTTQDLSNPMIQYQLKWHDVNIPDISTFVKHLHGHLSTSQKYGRLDIDESVNVCNSLKLQYPHWLWLWCAAPMPMSLSFVPPRSEEESPVSVFGSLPGTKPTNIKIWSQT